MLRTPRATRDEDIAGLLTARITSGWRFKPPPINRKVCPRRTALGTSGSPSTSGRYLMHTELNSRAHHRGRLQRRHHSGFLDLFEHVLVGRHGLPAHAGHARNRC